MAIPTYSSVAFHGTEQTVITTAVALMADNAWTPQTEAVAWTNTDNVSAVAVNFSGTLTAACAAGATVQVHIRAIEKASGGSDPQPSDNFLGGFRHSIPLHATQTAQDVERTFSIPLAAKTAQKYEFYFKLVGTGTTLISGAVLKLTPVAFGPKG